MTPAWLPLVGVIIGAFIGGGAQIIANLLTRGESRRHHRREVRREAYVNLMESAHNYMSYAVLTREEPERPGEPDGSDVFPYLERMSNAVARVELVAPDDTYQAAGFVAQQLRLWADGEDAIQRGGFREFNELAKRDLGLDQHERTLRQRVAKTLGRA